MKQNMGIVDRIVRVVFVLGVAVLYGVGFLSGTVGIVLALLAIVLGLTAVLGFCPLYYPFKISTKKATGAA